MATGDHTPERWATVTCAGDYEVSDRGRVRSMKTGCPRMLVPQPNRKGYLRVGLRHDGRGFTRVVHRLVLEAFAGEQPTERHECNHRNGIKSDNRIENLEWVTPVENNAHAVETGLWHPHKGEDHGRAVLTEMAVRVIRRAAGMVTDRFWAGIYGTSTYPIYAARTRRLWKHIP